MKKRLVLLALLLATAVFAQNNLDSNYTKTIPRYDDFPLDNIHIVRLQQAASALGGNVSALQGELRSYEEQRSREMSEMRGSLDSFQRSILAQVAALQNSVDSLSGRAINPPEVAVPAEIKFPPYMLVLLGANIFLLVIVIILIFWLREQYYVHRETHKEEHIHPAPPELIAYVGHQLEHDKSLRDIRMELAGKGWTPSIIEHAIHAAKEK